jgi:hypothetical protein
MKLIAVGIENDIFDEKVAYNYWFGALVGHCKDSDQIINLSRSEPDDLSAFISLIRLNTLWKKKLDRWAKMQPGQPVRAMVVPGPVSQPPSTAEAGQPKDG